jgi:hypothetical protein
MRRTLASMSSGILGSAAQEVRRSELAAGDGLVGARPATAAASRERPPRSRLPRSRLLGEERIQHLLVIGFCTAFSLIGWLMIVQGAEQVHVVRQAAQWPTAPGLIESVDMYEAEGSQGTQFRPHVSYSYVVDGRVIMGTRLTPGRAPAVRSFAAAEQFLARYPARTPVTVFYSPTDATESVLEVETPGTVYVHLAFGAALACLGPALLLLFGFSPYGRVRRAALAPGSGQASQTAG